MKNSELGYVPEADYFERKLRSMQQFHDAQADDVMVRVHLGFAERGEEREREKGEDLPTAVGEKTFFLTSGLQKILSKTSCLTSVSLFFVLSPW